ncbi:MAG: 16S rRNA (cytidine(1402)-2'-O)-methyltransferase [Ruminococcaceae bacterium]|nr:16S rRNA (cytidine(1402)-2'-O)-methyltransferase [Oscillospiraceae bacterium]
MPQIEEKNRVLGGTLYLVSTPIGNLADLSERAVKVLSEVDFIAAEDTRNSLKLLTHFGISKPLVSYHEHNKRERGEQLVARMLAGESCALVSDAGTPAISDPGEDLVALCAERGVPVTGIPGCCAGITALTLSGLPTGRFTFEGFLPMDKKERRARLEELSFETRTMLLHEAPHKLRATLADLEKAFGGTRRISLCRELTKRNEEIFRTTLSEAIAYYEENEPRGEYVLVIEGGTAKREASPTEALALLPPADHVAYYEKEGMKRMDAIKAAAKDRGMPKNELYRLLCEEK